MISFSYQVHEDSIVDFVHGLKVIKRGDIDTGMILGKKGLERNNNEFYKAVVGPLKPFALEFLRNKHSKKMHRDEEIIKQLLSCPDSVLSFIFIWHGVHSMLKHNHSFESLKRAVECFVMANELDATLWDLLYNQKNIRKWLRNGKKNVDEKFLKQLIFGEV